AGSIDDVAGVLPQRASLGARIRITTNTSTVCEDGRTGITGPKGVVDARGIFQVERGQLPVRQDVIASRAVVAGLGLGADRGGGSGLDQTAVRRSVERRPVVVAWPACIPGSLSRHVSASRVA